MSVSHKLVVLDDAAMFVVSGNPDEGYDLYAVDLTHLGHHRRSWQAVAAAKEPEVVD